MVTLAVPESHDVQLAEKEQTRSRSGIVFGVYRSITGLTPELRGRPRGALRDASYHRIRLE
jgi:hypothetical protein